MKVGFLAHVYDHREGTGGYAVELVERLARSHEVTLYAASIKTSPPPGVQVVRVPAVRASAYLTVLSYPVGFRAVRRKHDVIHAQGFQTLYADVITVHIVQRAWRAALLRDGASLTPAERLVGGVVSRLERETFRRARALIAPSRRTAGEVEELTGRSDGVHVVPHGCDRDIAAGDRARIRRTLGLAEGDFVALYVGYPRKGLRPAITALEHLDGVHLAVLTHSGPDEWRRAPGSSSDRVHWFPGNTKLEDALAAADCLVHPTCYDTFGLPIAEALRAGLPVIASREAGAAELLVHERSAWLLSDRSPETIAGAIRNIRDRADLRATLIAGGREVCSRWTWDETARRTIAVYEACAHG